MDTGGASPSSRPDRGSGQRWTRLLTWQRADGTRTSRLAACFDDGAGGFIAVTIAAQGDQFRLGFQLVEIRSIADGEQDPRLGRILIDGRTMRFGLARTMWRSATGTTWTTLATGDPDQLVQPLRRGRSLVVGIEERGFGAALASLREPLADALREVCDPAQLPLARWLAD
jgi:hypothetical protein